MYDLKKQMEEEQRLLKAAKTKNDLNALFNGRTIIVKDGSDWENEPCTFVEMVGEGDRSNWKMKLKTTFGTLLELPASKVFIVTQTITTTKEEADKITNHVKKQFK